MISQSCRVPIPIPFDDNSDGDDKQLHTYCCPLAKERLKPGVLLLPAIVDNSTHPRATEIGGYTRSRGKKTAFFPLLMTYDFVVRTQTDIPVPPEPVTDPLHPRPLLPLRGGYPGLTRDSNSASGA